MKLTSPNYPKWYFSNGKDCHWLLTAPEGNIIALEFNYFQGSTLLMFDGICDQTRELKTVFGKMPHNEKWIISSSGRHMFVDFVIDIQNSNPGFSASIHFGNKDRL